MRDEITTTFDPILLWNAALAALAEGVSLPRRGQITGHEDGDGPTSALPVFDIVTDAGPVTVELLALPLGALTQSTLEIADLARLPAALSDSILMLVAEMLLHEGGDEVRRRVLSIRRGDAAVRAGGVRLVLTMQGIWAEPVELAVRAERAVLSALLLGALPKTPGRWPQALAARIELPCSLRLEGRTLPLARLSGLAVGDMILAGGGLILSGPHARYSLLSDGTNWTIGGMHMNDDLPPDTPAEAQAKDRAGEPLADIGSVPVRLSFVLSEHLLTVAQLQALTKGAVLPLDPSPPEPGRPVSILANGRAVGEGHVVEVDGQPAVRIARLFGA